MARLCLGTLAELIRLGCNIHRSRANSMKTIFDLCCRWSEYLPALDAYERRDHITVVMGVTVLALPAS